MILTLCGGECPPQMPDKDGLNLCSKTSAVGDFLEAIRHIRQNCFQTNFYFQNIDRQGCTKWRTGRTSRPQADFDRAEKIRPILLTLWPSLISSKILTWKIKMTHF